VPFEDQEYHRRRSEIELEVAVSARDEASAKAHFELARMHRARRQIVAQKGVEEIRAASRRPAIRIDKEA
jgi:hypothetical protein